MPFWNAAADSSTVCGPPAMDLTLRYCLFSSAANASSIAEGVMPRSSASSMRMASGAESDWVSPGIAAAVV
jgi:hypothetical protein